MNDKELNAAIFQDVNKLSTLPTVYVKLNIAISNPHSTIEDIAAIISADQASAAKILKVANSSMFNRLSKIDTIVKAIFYLGFREVSDIVFAMTIMNVFKKNALFPLFSPVDFWRHSIAVGIISRQIAVSRGIWNLENYFLGGVVHDIGKLFLWEYYEKEFTKALERAAERKCPLEEAENEILGTNHIIAGSMLAEAWNLPEPIVNSIKHHDTGSFNDCYDEYAISVHMANIAAKMMHLGNAGNNIISRLNKDAVERMNVDPGIFSIIYPSVIKSYNEINSILLMS
ncbi:MAG TPA: HDOD domain-containing protein [Ignavibacteriales bacterium]|nr:HDOD domain-containing protein [Ignavibacteriales bacterium]